MKQNGSLDLCDDDTLRAALLGYRTQLEQIQAKMAIIDAILRGRHPEAQAPEKRRGMSEAGLARIAAAQRKRWAAVRRAGK